MKKNKKQKDVQAYYILYYICKQNLIKPSN